VISTRVGFSKAIDAFQKRKFLTSDIDVALATAYARLTHREGFAQYELPSHSVAKALLVEETLEGQGLYRQDCELLLNILTEMFVFGDRVVEDGHLYRLQLSLDRWFADDQLKEVNTPYHIEEESAEPMLSTGTGTVTFASFSAWFRSASEEVFQQESTRKKDRGTIGPFHIVGYRQKISSRGR
jgi:hypothetical protein